MLPEIVEAVGGRMPVLVDSGFRRGSDIVKALAIGAQAVCIGRPYLWGLGAFGQPGVERVLAILRAETRTAMQQLGAPVAQGPRAGDGAAGLSSTPHRSPKEFLPARKFRPPEHALDMQPFGCLLSRHG